MSSQFKDGYKLINFSFPPFLLLYYSTGFPPCKAPAPAPILTLPKKKMSTSKKSLLLSGTQTRGSRSLPRFPSLASFIW